MQRALVHPRPPTERDCITRSCLLARIPIIHLCDIVERYAAEFEGLLYDPSNLSQLQIDQRSTSWLAYGPLPTRALVDVVSSYVQTLTPPSDSNLTSYGTMPVCVMPRGELAYWTATEGVCVWDGHTVKSCRQILARDWYPSALAALSDGCKLIVGLMSGDAFSWDVDTGSRHYLRKISNARVGAVTCLVVVSNELSREIVVAGTSAHEFRAWDVELNVCVWSWSNPSTLSSIFTMIPLPNGTVAAGAGNGSVCLRDIHGGQPRSFQGHRQAVKAIITLGDDLLATGSNDATVRVWDIKTQACLRCLEGHATVVLCLVELPNNRLASGSFDRTVRVWHWTTGDCLFTLTHKDPILAMVALPDFRLALASGSAVHVWNANDGTCQHVLKRHSYTVTKLAVLPGGQLASFDGHCTLYTWV